MIDTCRFYTLINKREKDVILKIGRRTMSYDLETGESFYDFTNSSLKGSWETRISLSILERVVVDDEYMYKLFIECSLHKLILGHNCFGGTDDLYSQLKYLQDVILKELKIYVDLNKIVITRLDIANCYKLKNQQQSINFIKQFRQVYYKSKSPIPYPTSVFWKLTDYSIKIYDKLEDFNVHDFKKSNFTPSFYKSIDGIVRIEITFRKKKLEHLHKKKNLTIYDLKIHKLNKFLNEIIYYLESFIGNTTNYEVISDFEQVRQRLYSNLKTRKASSLLSAYTIIKNLGLIQYKEIVSYATWYRHIKDLKLQGIDIANGKHLKTLYKEKLYPADFTMTNDKYKLKDDLIDCYLKII